MLVFNYLECIYISDFNISWHRIIFSRCRTCPIPYYILSVKNIFYIKLYFTILIKLITCIEINWYHIWPIASSCSSNATSQSSIHFFIIILYTTCILLSGEFSIPISAIIFCFWITKISSKCIRISTAYFFIIVYFKSKIFKWCVYYLINTLSSYWVNLLSYDIESLSI